MRDRMPMCILLFYSAFVFDSHRKIKHRPHSLPEAPLDDEAVDALFTFWFFPCCPVRCDHQGIGLPCDPVRARELYDEALQAGSSAAAYFLGQRFHVGDEELGISPDGVRALKLLRQASDKV